MRLDITAYSKLKAIGAHDRKNGFQWCDKGHVQAYAYKWFKASFRGLPILGGFTDSDGDEFIKGGCYEVTPETEQFGFHAGSYSEYGHRRRVLADLFNPERGRDGPFYELIYFADNEGTIGPEAAADLLADFREHEGAYRAAMRGDEHEYDFYSNFMRACEIAADGGLIDFH